jgi:hypothetical protein
MSARSKPIKFARQTRFEVCPIVTAPFRGLVEAHLETLKHKMLAPVLHNTHNPELQTKLGWAAQDAASLAWLTPFPLLVFPALFEEKVSAARKHWAKQQNLRKGLLPMPMALAA